MVLLPAFITWWQWYVPFTFHSGSGHCGIDPHTLGVTV